MFKSMALAGMQKFSARYNYDVSYFRYTIDASLSSFYKFMLIRLISTNRGPVPKPPWFAAGIRASLAEDCGPCVQLACSFAREAGVDATTISHVLSQSYDELPEEVAFTCRFTDLTVAKSPEADDLREKIVARWGDKALVCLAMGTSAIRLYPLYKQALGYGKACEVIEIDDARIVPRGITTGLANS